MPTLKATPPHQHVSHTVTPASVLSFPGLSFLSCDMSLTALSGAMRWSRGSDPLSCIFPNATQISLEVNSQEQSLELRAQGHDGDFVSCIFSVPQLFDLRWHKLQLSVAERVASVHVDCTSAFSQPLGPRRPIRPVGHVFLGLDAEQAKPVSVSARWASGLRSRFLGACARSLESDSDQVLPLPRVLAWLLTTPRCSLNRFTWHSRPFRLGPYKCALWQLRSSPFHPGRPHHQDWHISRPLPVLLPPPVVLFFACPSAEDLLALHAQPHPPFLWAKVNMSPSSPSFLHAQCCSPCGDSHIPEGLPGRTRNSLRPNPRVEPPLCLTGDQGCLLK